MPSRFTQYGGVQGADDALREMVAARIAAEIEQRKRAVEDYKLGQTDHGLGIQQQQVNQAGQPKPQGPVVLAPGGRLVAPTGEMLAEAPHRPAPPAPPERPMNLAPGGRLIMPSTGETIASAPDRPQAAQSDTGWGTQQVSDPKTNTTQLVRVNSRTGEVQPVKLPDGMQAGGQRQTRLTAGQQEDLATMKTVEDMTKEVSTLGDQIGWKGVGALFSGSLSQGAANLGWGTPDEERLRNKIANIQGTIAKLRGGTSFTPNEQKLLDSYTPTINDGDMRIKAKLQSLQEFITTKRKNTFEFAGAGMGDGEPAPTTQKWIRVDGKLVRQQ